MSSAVPRLSASVVLLRRSTSNPKHFQVLLAQRAKSLNSFSSFFVFPGGVAEDCDADLAQKYAPEDARGNAKMTGIRELFEEAGVLLQKSATAQQAVAKPLNDHSWQDRVHDDAAEMEKLLEELQVAPGINALKYWVTFITPKIEKRRFETNFFLALVDDATVKIDGGETVRYMWLTPKEALQQNREGSMAILPPQHYVLSTIAQFGDVDDLIAHAERRNPEVPILPHALGFDDNVLTLAYPGDEQHPHHPGKPGDRRRMHCTTPMGTGGYKLEDNRSSTGGGSKL